jgi:hypothetical protein
MCFPFRFLDGDGFSVEDLDARFAGGGLFPGYLEPFRQPVSQSKLRSADAAMAVRGDPDFESITKVRDSFSGQELLAFTGRKVK